MRRPRSCRNCRSSAAVVRGLCRTCYVYRRRTGRHRPEELVVRAGYRDQARRELATAVLVRLGSLMLTEGDELG